MAAVLRPATAYLSTAAAGSRRRAVVTGATGYLATELIFQLLQRGYLVRGTARNINAARLALAPVAAAAGAVPGELELVELPDLTTASSSLPSVLEDCDVLFHTASPFFPAAPGVDVRRALLEPAVLGTRHVLTAAAEAQGGGGCLDRVVLTSSIAAVRGGESVPGNGSFFTEEDWNVSSKADGGGFEPYLLSKTLAEREAWLVAEQEGLDLVSVNPAFLVGPPRVPRQGSTSVEFMRTWLERGCNPLARHLADVRDVAMAHIAAAEVPSAHGRYIVSSPYAAPPPLVARVLAEAFPGLALEEELEDLGMEHPMTMDGRRAEVELGITRRSVDRSLTDMAHALVDMGLAKPRWQHELAQAAAEEALERRAGPQAADA